MRKIMVDCPQNIPCNPCTHACPTGAIFIGEDITAYFILDYASAVESGDRNIRHVHLPCQSADVPTTGDNASLALWAMMAVLSACGLWMLSRKRCMR